MSILSLNYSI